MTNDYSVRIRTVRLAAPSHAAFGALAHFYCGQLGLEELADATSLLAVRVGETRLEFRPAGPRSAPFYHYALLAPGNRFTAAHDWLARRAELLPDPETGETTFDFATWDALACYCHDPIGNIVEIIAVAGLAEARAANEPFDSPELLGVAEIGLVGADTAAMAETLRREVGIRVWDGTLEEPGRLAFAGELGSTVILCPTGRGWLPTGRPAEVHPTEVVFAGDVDAAANIRGLPYSVCIVSE
jgi:catechol-2,3-dioxygenase